MFLQFFPFNLYESPVIFIIWEWYNQQSKIASAKVLSENIFLYLLKTWFVVIIVKCIFQIPLIPIKIIFSLFSENIRLSKSNIWDLLTEGW